MKTLSPEIDKLKHIGHKAYRTQRISDTKNFGHTEWQADCSYPRQGSSTHCQVERSQKKSGRGQCEGGFSRTAPLLSRTPPFYTDNQTHDLAVERFFKPRMEGSMMMTAHGPLKTFTPLR